MYVGVSMMLKEAYTVYIRVYIGVLCIKMNCIAIYTALSSRLITLQRTTYDWHSVFKNYCTVLSASTIVLHPGNHLCKSWEISFVLKFVWVGGYVVRQYFSQV